MRRDVKTGAGNNVNIEGFFNAKVTIKEASGFYDRRRNSLHPIITFSPAIADTSTTRISDASSAVGEPVSRTATYRLYTHRQQCVETA